MQSWGLPSTIVAAVRDVDRPLHTPVHMFDPRQAPRLALCYLATRLGERAAQGQPVDTTALLARGPPDPDTWHLVAYLALPALAGVPALLEDARVQAAIGPMQHAAE